MIGDDQLVLRTKITTNGNDSITNHSTSAPRAENWQNLHINKIEDQIEMIEKN